MANNTPNSVRFTPSSQWDKVVNKDSECLDEYIARAMAILVAQIAQDPEIVRDFMARILIWSEGRRPQLWVSPNSLSTLKESERELLEYILQEDAAQSHYEMEVL